MFVDIHVILLVGIVVFMFGTAYGYTLGKPVGFDEGFDAGFQDCKRIIELDLNNQT